MACIFQWNLHFFVNGAQKRWITLNTRNITIQQSLLLTGPQKPIFRTSIVKASTLLLVSINLDTDATHSAHGSLRGVEEYILMHRKVDTRWNKLALQELDVLEHKEKWRERQEQEVVKTLLPSPPRRLEEAIPAKLPSVPRIHLTSRMYYDNIYEWKVLRR